MGLTRRHVLPTPQLKESGDARLRRLWRLAREGDWSARRRLVAHGVGYVLLGAVGMFAVPATAAILLPFYLLYSLGEATLEMGALVRDALRDAGVLRQQRPPRQGGDGGDDGVP